tara:strand:- start:53596 stop:54969 length:1374 start_codon:yes stop_codon:yes gene_type:complete
VSKKEKHIDDIIKNSFDEQADDFDFGSWDKLEDRLDRENDVDKAVVSAYEFPEEEVSSSVWSNVNDELDIDTVWSRIDVSLDKRKRRALWWWNAASIGFAAAFVTLFFINLPDSQSIDKRYARDEQILYVDSIAHENSKGSYFLQEQIAKIDEQNVSEDGIKKKGFSKTPKGYSRGISNQGDTSDHSNLKAEKSDLEKGSAESSKVHRNNLTLDKKPDSLEQIDPLSPILIHDLFDNLSALPDTITNVDREEQLNKNYNWTAGITTGILSTSLMDALFRESLSSNSLTSSEFSIAINPGLFAQYRTQNNWVVQADLYLNYKISRRINLYEDLSYVTRKTELKYQRLHLYGGKRFLITESSRSSTFFETSLGGFVSYLSDQREYRGRTLVSDQKTLSDWNVGLDGDFGIVHNFKRLSLAYGAQVNKGLFNVMKETSTKSWNRASTLSTGLYFRLGYQF